jgi:molybdate transport system substrate-binding protein
MTSQAATKPKPGARSGNNPQAWRLLAGQVLLGTVLLLAALVALPTRAADLMVAAAASLTNAFTEMGKAYEKATPGTRILFTFAASGQLLQQISRGAPVHVFASADLETMDRAENAKLIRRSSRVNFAANQLLVVLPGDSTLDVSSLSDLAKPQVQKIALGAPESVPVGRYAKGALEKAGLWSQLSSKFIFTQNVRQSLDYVFRGEVDAGFVYATDAAISPVKVRTAFQVSLDSPILYPIAAVVGFGNEDRALEFIAFVRSDAGQAILAKYGFLKP